MALPAVVDWLPIIAIGAGFIAVMAVVGWVMLIHTEQELRHILYGPTRKDEYFKRPD